MTTRFVTVVTLWVGTVTMLAAALFAAYERSSPSAATSVITIVTDASGKDEARQRLVEKNEKMAVGFENALQNARTAKYQTFQRRPSDTMLVAADPKLQALYLDAERARVLREYGLFFEKERLSPEQRVRFASIMVEHAAARLDLLGEVRGVVPEPSSCDAALSTLVKEEREKFGAALRSLLGDAGFEEKARFDQTIHARELIAKFAGDVAQTEPLSPARAEQLTTELCNASSTFRREGFFVIGTVDFATADRAAALLLTPTQFSVWKASTDETRWSVKISEAMTTAAAAHRAASAVQE